MSPPNEQQQPLLSTEVENSTNGGASAANSSNVDIVADDVLEKQQNHKQQTTSSIIIAASDVLTNDEGEDAIQRFCEMIKYPTVSSLAIESGAYRQCADWLVQQLLSVGAFDEVYLLPESPTDAPVVVAKWVGLIDDESRAPAILLNSHYDVVPVCESDWTVPAFNGYRKDGNIYGRGTQDMKCVCVQYIESIRKIRKNKPDWKPFRNIYLTFVPDEEVGGGGMAAFLDSSMYKEKLSDGRIALALDEGLASEDENFAVFYGERLPWWVDVTATGPTGHGSRFIDNTAVEQLLELANKALAFRQGQRELLGLKHDTNCSHAVAAKAVASKKIKTLGDVTSLNITTLEAGVRVGNTYAYNCVPPKARCSMDIRISPHTSPVEIGKMLDLWCTQCSKGGGGDGGNTVQWKFIGHSNNAQGHAITSTDPVVNPWYQVFAKAVEESVGHTTVVKPQIFPAATDSRFLRALGIKALGFSPIRCTKIMLHENDEYIPEERFLEGIGVYYHLIQALGSFVES